MADKANTGLEDRVITSYLSSSAGVHRRCTSEEVDDFVEAYRWYLDGWIPRGREWLDLACGQGQLMTLAVRAGFTVVGVDMSAEMLEVARARHPDVVHQDALEYLSGVAPASLDVISAFDFLEHLHKDLLFDALVLCRRALRPSGTLLAKIPNGSSPWAGAVFHADLTHHTLLTSHSFQQVARLAGFSTCEFREVGPVPRRIVGNVRWLLWRAVRSAYRLLNAIETGAPGSVVLTRVMLVRLR